VSIFPWLELMVADGLPSANCLLLPRDGQDKCDLHSDPRFLRGEVDFRVAIPANRTIFALLPIILGKNASNDLRRQPFGHRT
jgi:hypothetical protein